MKEDAFKKLCAQVQNLTDAQKIGLCRELGFDEQTDNFGQILFYTQLKADDSADDGFRELTEKDLGW
jgi:hypothetical protein